MVLSQEEARLLGHHAIGSEHLLLGLIREEDGIAAQALQLLGVSLQAARMRVEDSTDSPPSISAVAGAGGSPPFTPRAKKILELSLREALQLGHQYIGTEHILLGLVREGRGVGAHVLMDLGTDLPRVRETVLGLMAGMATLGPSAGLVPSTGPGPSTGIGPSAGLGPSATFVTSEPLLPAAEERALGEAVARGRQAEERLRASPRPAPAEREALVRAVGEGDEAQARLVEGTIPHLRDVVRLWAGRGGGEFDRLLAVGSTGLVTAARHYDPSRGFRFAVYATWWIHRALEQSLRDSPALESVEVGDRACSFCGRHRTEVAVMVAHHGEAICEQCTDVFLLQLLGSVQQGKQRYEAARTKGVVRCAHCRAPLAGAVVMQRLSIQGDHQHDLLVAACGSCGALISGIPSPTSTPEP